MSPGSQPNVQSVIPAQAGIQGVLAPERVNQRFPTPPP